jgi:hypothetical protein
LKLFLLIYTKIVGNFKKIALGLRKQNWNNFPLVRSKTVVEEKFQLNLAHSLQQASIISPIILPVHLIRYFIVIHGTLFGRHATANVENLFRKFFKSEAFASLTIAMVFSKWSN